MDIFYVSTSNVPLTMIRKDFIRRFIKAKCESYIDKDLTQIQCEKGRFRSITELHQIVLSRFPKTSFEAILRIVKDLINEENPVSMIYCTQVNKVVLKYLNSATRNYMSDYSRQNYYTTKGVDGYSLKQYEQIINNLK